MSALKMREFWIVLLVASLLSAIVYRAPSAQSRTSGVWLNDMCATDNCIKRRLEGLTPERAAEAKLTTWGNFTYVWYRQ